MAIGQNSTSGKEVWKRIQKMTLNPKGTLAPDFVQKDINGKLVKLSDFKGKYILLDFWASWCAPCRTENPNILSLYKWHKNENFTIVSVSIDEKKEDWLKAIGEDALPWTQLSDIGIGNQHAEKLYSIKSVPANFLIDIQGKILGINLHEKDHAEKLCQVLGIKHLDGYVD